MLVKTTEGTPQGAVVTPLLANIYLHHVYDLWVQRWRKRPWATGYMIVVRCADDTVVGFQNSGDAKRFHDDLEERLKEFALDLHPEKTRFVAFGRFVRRPGTFDFLGFTHIIGKRRNSKGFQLWRKTSCKRNWAFISRIAEELRRHRHAPIDERGRWLPSVLKGHYAYFAVPTNIAAVRAVRHHVKIRWYKTLRCRSQRHRTRWARTNVIVARNLPPSSLSAKHPASVARLSLPRQSPETGAGCLNWARPDLRGGRPATVVPTAIAIRAGQGALQRLDKSRPTPLFPVGFPALTWSILPPGRL